MDKKFIFASRIDDKLCSWAAELDLQRQQGGEHMANPSELGSGCISTALMPRLGWEQPSIVE
jgi:hypothetical protein